MTTAAAERTLVWILRFFGALTLTAVFPMLMPTDWMVAVNDWLGLDPFTRSPLMEYLTRSLSAVYALFGALAIYATLDLRRYLPLVEFMSRLTIVLGFVLTWIGFRSGLPASWAWTEGPPTVVLGIVMVWLARRAARSASAETAR